MGYRFMIFSKIGAEVQATLKWKKLRINQSNEIKLNTTLTNNFISFPLKIPQITQTKDVDNLAIYLITLSVVSI